MSEIPEDRLREILAGCEGVTPGGWAGGKLGYVRELVSGKERILASTHGPNARRDAKHIARLDPATVSSIVTELLDRRSRDDTAEKMAAALHAHNSYMMSSGYSGPDDSALHPNAAQNWRQVREALNAFKRPQP